MENQNDNEKVDVLSLLGTLVGIAGLIYAVYVLITI